MATEGNFLRNEGVVLKIFLQGETSLLVRIFSQNFGILSVVAKGARRRNSIFFGKLDVFMQVEFTLRLSSKSNLHFLKEVEILEDNRNLALSQENLLLSSYFFKLVEASCEQGTPIDDIYALSVKALRYIETKKNPEVPRVLYRFERHLASLLGLEDKDYQKHSTDFLTNEAYFHQIYGQTISKMNLHKLTTMRMALLRYNIHNSPNFKQENIYYKQ